MARKRPSGAGSNSKRFAVETRPDGTQVRVPATKDIGTFVYIAGEDGSWPKLPTTTLLLDLPWLQEGATVRLRDMRPGEGMGREITVQVIEQRVAIAIFPGRYGQVQREVLVDEVAAFEDVMAGEPR